MHIGDRSSSAPRYMSSKQSETHLTAHLRVSYFTSEVQRRSTASDQRQKVSVCPVAQAWYSGVLPISYLDEMSASQSISARAAFECPYMQAQCSGVFSQYSLAEMSAPRAIILYWPPDHIPLKKSYEKHNHPRPSRPPNPPQTTSTRRFSRLEPQRRAIFFHLTAQHIKIISSNLPISVRISKFHLMEDCFAYCESIEHN
jgi:hypothetical protein